MNDFEAVERSIIVQLGVPKEMLVEKSPNTNAVEMAWPRLYARIFRISERMYGYPMTRWTLSWDYWKRYHTKTLRLPAHKEPLRLCPPK